MVSKQQPDAVTILLVDDDGFVRRSVALCLRRIGYQVLEAASGMEAMLLWEKHCSQIQLLFTDIVMPGMTGLELVQILRRDRPALKVIITSGYNPGGKFEDMARQPGMFFLAKPFEWSNLLQTIKQLMELSPEWVSDHKQAGNAALSG